MVEERTETQHVISRQVRREDHRRPDPEHHGLVWERSHSDINALIMNDKNRDRRSVLISNEQREPIDDDFYKRKSVFERLGKSSTKAMSTDTDTMKNNRQYQVDNEQSNNKRPKLDSNNIQTEPHERNYMQSLHQTHNLQGQTQHKGVRQDKQVQSKYSVNNNDNNDRRRSNQGYSQAKDKSQYEHQNQDKYDNKPRKPERYEKEGKGENAHTLTGAVRVIIVDVANKKNEC